METNRTTITRATPAPKKTARKTAKKPYTPEDVAALAYQRFLDRGGLHGFDVADWLAAEQGLSSVKPRST